MQINQVVATNFMADFAFISPLGLQQVNAIAKAVVQEINEENWYSASQLRLSIYDILTNSSGGINLYGTQS
jgi:hypothetical protein